MSNDDPHARWLLMALIFALFAILIVGQKACEISRNGKPEPESEHAP